MNSILVLMAVCLSNGPSEEKSADSPKYGDLEVDTRKYRTWSKKTGNYEVGTFYIPENRSKPNSRVIGIGFSRFKAKRPNANKPPIFFLPGGPGSSYLEVEEDDPQLRKTPWYIESLWQDCDCVFVDQRGYSRRGEILRGQYRGAAPTPESSIESRVKEARRFAAEVVDAYENTDIDLSGYHVLEMVEDVNELRDALGYDKITLRGQSYGSQWSFAIMKQHPEIVERALLTGVEPLDNGYDRPSHLLNAMKRIWTHLESDARFKKYLPDGGFQVASHSVAKRLHDHPIELKKASLLGFGELRTVRILGPRDFPWHEPRHVLELYHDQTARWTSERKRGWGKTPIIYHLVDSSLGITPARREELENDPACRFISKPFKPLMEAAEIWPTPDVGDEFRTPRMCDIPVLFINGDWDTNTPIENMHEIAPYFPNSHSMTVHRAGHGTVGTAMYEQHPKVFGRVMQFLRTGAMEELPKEITFEPYRDFDPPTFKLPDTRKPD